jgi:1-deoxyxylulose-5-phosphate synthase
MCPGFALAASASHTAGWARSWAFDEAGKARPIIRIALGLGIKFFDTANVHSPGLSEGILGRAIKDYANRGEVAIATKVHGKMREDPHGSGLSRKAVMGETDNSLQRLGMDYVDLHLPLGLCCTH